jgi:hypothetical protein
MPDGMQAADAPAAMMVNGKILCALTPPSGIPTSFYEYAPAAGAFTQVDGPLGTNFYSISDEMRMLDLPDGTVLFVSDNAQLFIYQPDGSPLPAGQPAIATLTTNGNGSYHLTGTLFNGISEGAAYGDDAQMSSDYPIVRLTNTSGSVYYCRTFDWSHTGIMTGTNLVTTEFTLPTNLPVGIYGLVVSANGNASAAIPFIFSPDALLVSPATGFFAAGTAGGPFAPTSITMTLTNVGTSSLSWSLGNTST